MREEQFHFWQKCLTAANVLAACVGLMVAFAGNSIFFAYYNQSTLDVFLSGETMTPEVLAIKNWLFGIIGASIVGFQILMIFIAEYAFKRKEKWAYWAMCSGLLSWFLIDTGISWYYGALHNIAIINLPALIAIGLPLWMTRKEF